MDARGGMGRDMPRGATLSNCWRYAAARAGIWGHPVFQPHEGNVWRDRLPQRWIPLPGFLLEWMKHCILELNASFTLLVVWLREFAEQGGWRVWQILEALYVHKFFSSWTNVHDCAFPFNNSCCSITLICRMQLVQHRNIRWHEAPSRAGEC